MSKPNTKPIRVIISTDEIEAGALALYAQDAPRRDVKRMWRDETQATRLLYLHSAEAVLRAALGIK